MSKSKATDTSTSALTPAAGSRADPQPAQEPVRKDAASTADLEPDTAVERAIADVQADKGYVHQSTEHLEGLVVERLVGWGHDLAWAVHAVRSRLY